MPHPQPDWVVMGRILGPFGVKGWIKIRTFTEYPDSLADYPAWSLDEAGSRKQYTVESTQVHSGQLVAKLAGIDDRDQAFLLRGIEIAVPRDALPPTAEGEYYWADLIGLAVVNLQDEPLGTVSSLLETGANDVLVVQDGATERLLPYVDAVVQSVDLAARRIVVDWGLDY